MIRTVRAPAAPVRSRIYEKLIWDTVRSQPYESFAELVAAVKDRCARLRVPYHQHEVDDALARMGDKVTNALQPLPGPQPAGPALPPDPLTKAEARAILARLSAIPRAMPAARPATDREADRRGAARVVAQAILDAVARCEDAER